MERRQLGLSTHTVPVIGMGTWRTFDTDEDRRPVVDSAIGSGIDLFDSSPIYGRAEATLARALEGMRQQVQVATKIWTASAEEGQAQADCGTHRGTRLSASASAPKSASNGA